MATFKLDDIRKAAEKKYAATEIEVADGEVVRLVNVLRLPKLKRNALEAIQERMSAEGEEKLDTEEGLAEAIRLVAETDSQAEKLLGAVGGDLAVLAEIFSEYTGGTEAGEASPSHD